MTTEQQKARDRGYQLVYALRVIDEIENFKWNFRVFSEKDECGTVGCACGLARYLWSELNDYHTVQSVGDFVGLGWDESSKLFCLGDTWEYDNKTKPEDVTAKMVADALETELKKLETD